MSERRPHTAAPRFRTVFLGSDHFSVSILEALLTGAVDLVGVVTRPDRRAGRGRALRPTPVKEAALGRDLQVLEPERVTAPTAVAQLRALEPDLLVLAAYAQTLSAEVLSVTRVAPLNVHPSLLPRYRGAAPVPWAIIRGETETGVTIIRMSEEVDAGLILAQERTLIAPEETAGDLEARLAAVGGRLLLATLARLEEALAHARSQGPAPGDGSALAPRLTKADGQLDWRASAEGLRNRVRGLSPWPGTYTSWDHGGDVLRLKLLRVAARKEKRPSGEPPGTVVEVTDETVLVQTGDGLLELHELQPAGGRAMEIAAFLRGHRVEEGDCFLTGE